MIRRFFERLMSAMQVQLEQPTAVASGTSEFDVRVKVMRANGAIEHYRIDPETGDAIRLKE